MVARSLVDRHRALAGPPTFPPRRPKATAWGFFFMGGDDIMRSSMVKQFGADGSVGSVKGGVTEMVDPAAVDQPEFAFSKTARVLEYKVSDAP